MKNLSSLCLAALLTSGFVLAPAGLAANASDATPDTAASAKQDKAADKSDKGDQDAKGDLDSKGDKGDKGKESKSDKGKESKGEKGDKGKEDKDAKGDKHHKGSHKLPKTASPAGNLIVLSGSIALMGAALLVTRRRRQSFNQA